MRREMRLYKFCLIKAYFEKGYGLTSYIKYLIILLGLHEGFTTQSIRITSIIAIVYGLSCFVIGYLWYKLRIVDAELEVSNRFNPFVREMRCSINRKT